MQDIAGLEGAIDGATGYDVGDEHAVAVIGKAKGFAHGWVVEGKFGDTEFSVLVVGAILDVFEEPIDDGGGDDVAGVIGFAEALEGDADDFAVLKDGAAGVAGVDGGIDLNDEV